MEFCEIFPILRPMFFAQHKIGLPSAMFHQTHHMHRVRLGEILLRVTGEHVWEMKQGNDM
jgi:hypothetical protein